MVFEYFLGDCLVKNDGTKVQTSELSTEKGAVIGLYFSAHWCGPCRAFTPRLSAIYKEIRGAGHSFEIVFVSSDENDDKFNNYHAEMPWLAVPYENDAKKDACSEKFKVEGLPTLALLDASTGDTISSDGRAAVETYGASGFPFTTAKLEECRKEKNAKKQSSLKRMGSLSFLGPLTTIETNEAKLELESVVGASEAIALAFVKGGKCLNSSLVISKLIEAHNTLGESKLGIIIVPLVDMGELGDDFKATIKDIPMVTAGDKAANAVRRFEEISSNIEAPYVIVIAPDDNSSFNLYAEDVAREIYFTGAPGFPWSSEALDALAAKEEAMKQKFKERQKNLEFLSSNEQSHVINNTGDEVSLATLQTKEVVGLYFSAHWCGPCVEFTPRLAELYKECHDQGKSFEVVFVSSDRDKEEFEEYFAEMPWCALSYSERALKGSLSELFEVQGIPKLVLLTGSGELITQEGRQNVGKGVEYYPWSKDVMEKGDAHA